MKVGFHAQDRIMERFEIYDDRVYKELEKEVGDISRYKLLSVKEDMSELREVLVRDKKMVVCIHKCKIITVMKAGRQQSFEAKIIQQERITKNSIEKNITNLRREIANANFIQLVKIRKKLKKFKERL